MRRTRREERLTFGSERGKCSPIVERKPSSDILSLNNPTHEPHSHPDDSMRVISEDIGFICWEVCFLFERACLHVNVGSKTVKP